MRAGIVQLSDIHFRDAQNQVQARVGPIAAAISSTDPTCRTFIIVVTGDIAQSGVEKEYVIAQQFFGELSKAIRGHRPEAVVYYLIIPGNHDCYLPKPEVQLREVLVQAIQPSLQTVPDPSILESLLKSQQAYFQFCQKVCESRPTAEQQLCRTHILQIAGYAIQFNLYNTAALSTRHEKQGSLSLPMGLVSSTITLHPDANLSISSFHHPYNWLESNTSLAFRAHVERTSDIILTGHQHQDHGFDKQMLSGEHFFYSEALVLQDAVKPDDSGFRIILIDLADRNRRIVSYAWSSSHYSAQNDTGWGSYNRTANVAVVYPTTDFLTTLSDSGVGLTHPAQGPLTLETVFVYPDATARSLVESESPRDIHCEKLFGYISDRPRIIIQGQPFSGKTSLAKTLARDWLRSRLFYPILVDGSTIKRGHEAFFDRLIGAQAAVAYGEPSKEKYRQLQPTVKALIIDDWDDCPLSDSDRDLFLKRAEAHFGKIVLLVDSFSKMQHVMALIEGKEAILNFELISLHEMSYVARGKLVERWLSLGTSQGTGNFSRRVEETERLVNTVIGKNTLPSLPFIVLALLQASENVKDIIPENGSFGYLYEVLITTALNATQGKKTQLDKKYTFLSLLAYRFFELSIDLLGESDVHVVLDEYSRAFMVKVDKVSLLRDLEYSRILVKRDGNYSFLYPHFYQYFLARYFKTNLHGVLGPVLRANIKSILNELHVGSNRTFLMFVIYLTHDEQLTEELLSIGNSVLSEFPASDLTSEVDFYNELVEAGIERAIPSSVDLQANRQRRRQVEDDRRSKEPPKDRQFALSLSTQAMNDMPLPMRLDYARSCMEVLGQMLRNFTGSLPGERKLAILETTYRLGLRVLRAILSLTSEATHSANDALGKLDQNKAEVRQLAKNVERLLTVLAQLVGLSVIKGISLSVGSPDIEEEAYSRILDQVGRTNATQLIDLAIKLDHFEEYPFRTIKELKKQFETNRFAYRILRDLVVENMQIFEIGHAMRQRVLATLGATSRDEALVSRATKRLK